MELKRIFEIIKQLRAEDGGCPWDKEQTLSSLIKPLKEEVDELEEAICNNDSLHIQEELGDVLWNVCMMYEVAREEGVFLPEDSITGVSEKMVTRHPHVFGELKAKNAEEALAMFKKAKAQSRGEL